MKTWKTRRGYQITRVLSGRSNVFLVYSTKTIILVDTGPSGAWKKLQERLEGLGIDEISFLVLTHSHYDHAANAGNIREMFNAQVIVHQSEADILQKGASIIPMGTNLLTRNIISPLGSRLASCTDFKGCKPDIMVEKQYRFVEPELNAYILHTPGHTAGSMSLIVDDEIAIVGDAMFGILPWSVFPPFADNKIELTASWKRLLETSCNVFLPSHGSGVSRRLLENQYRKRLK
jgi:glyoxylase-like metal-dependent hydrolase (beta-lactamase superfamily II)